MNKKKGFLNAASITSIVFSSFLLVGSIILLDQLSTMGLIFSEVEAINLLKDIYIFF